MIILPDPLGLDSGTFGRTAVVGRLPTASPSPVDPPLIRRRDFARSEDAVMLASILASRSLLRRRGGGGGR